MFLYISYTGSYYEIDTYDPVDSAHRDYTSSRELALHRVCRACTVVIAGYEHTFDLMLLDMVELDVITGKN